MSLAEVKTDNTEIVAAEKRNSELKLEKAESYPVK